MAELTSTRTWTMRIGYISLCALIIFFHLLPLDTVPRQWAPPDLLIAFTFAWALRRPDFVPALAIAVVMLLADFLFQRPPGLMAVLVVVGSEYLKTRFSGLSDASFVGEWASVAIVLVAITAANRIILGLMAVEQAQLVLSLSQLILTLMIYPVIALITHYVLGVSKLAPSDQDVLGSRV